MARDSGGTQTRVAGAAPTTNQLSSSAKFNSEMDDITTELTDSLSRSNKGAMLADLNHGAFSAIFTERSAPASPAADKVALYAADNGSGTTHAYLKDSAGTVTDLCAGGTIGGSTGSTDNRIVRSDGTGGSTAQSSAVTIDDSGNISGVGTLSTSGNITINSQQALHVGTSATPGQTIVSGYAFTLYSYGNKTAGGSLTVDPSLGPHQKVILTSTGGAAVTITAPSTEGECILKILNNSGGTVTAPTFSGFDKVFSGDTFNTADGKINWVFIYNLDGIQVYQIKNMN